MEEQALEKDRQPSYGWMPLTAGILSIFSGIVGIIATAFVITGYVFVRCMGHRHSLNSNLVGRHTAIGCQPAFYHRRLFCHQQKELGDGVNRSGFCRHTNSINRHSSLNSDSYF